ncbi:MAG: hypothetical protein J3R72DRAFT_451022 [Linnemannia gamsii]|nr:MAG: hypothetical protein J3R72DRAFT_451022 [Linnemannia gamsii]
MLFPLLSYCTGTIYCTFFLCPVEASANASFPIGRLSSRQSSRACRARENQNSLVFFFTIVLLNQWHSASNLEYHQLLLSLLSYCENWEEE